jgi:lysophospholipase L1-like esterase
LVRMPYDVLDREGITHVIFLEGTNDIAAGTTAASLIAADQQIIADAHARGLKIIGATITPRGGESVTSWTPPMEQQRAAVNDWIRHGNQFDGVIDFDAALRGQLNPAGYAFMMNPSLTSLDHVHPNQAGYAAMAAAIDLRLFQIGGDHQ